NVPIGIAKAVKQKQRHKSTFQCEIHVSSRISESAKQSFNAPRHSCRHESARAKQVVLAPSGHHVAEIDKPGQPPIIVFAAQEKILWNEFAGENDRGSVRGNKDRRVSKNIVQPV